MKMSKEWKMRLNFSLLTVFLMLLLLIISVCRISDIVNYCGIAEPVATSKTEQTFFAETISVNVKPSMKGMTVNAWSAEAYDSSDFDQSITNLASIRANWVTFTVFWFMEHYNDTEMHPRPDLYTASDKSLIHAIQKAHELEMKVVLKPMVDVVDGTWRGQISSANWTLWFENYRKFINYYADLAEVNNVELFTVGTELRSSQPYESRWRQVISEVRTRFSRNITYAANWDSYRTGSIKFWDALDYVGVDAYFPLTSSFNPTVSQLMSAWSSCTASGFIGRNWTNELYSTYTDTGKKIIFTEIGYCSQDGTNTQPWNWNISPTVDLQEQADCYQAALEVFENKSWFEGWFWWSWETDPNAGGSTDKHYTPQNKPAQNILMQHYYEPNIAVTEVVCSKNVVGDGYTANVSVVVENQGIRTETFNLTAYVNTTSIASQIVILSSGNSTNVIFVCDTIGLVKGNYTVSAYAVPVPDETNITDNRREDGWILITVSGDINGDLRVDIQDLVLVIKCFGSYPGSIKPWNPNADINSDGKVDIQDLVLVIKHFGEHYP